MQFMSEVMADAERTRAVPIEEPGIPKQKVNGKWDITLLKITADSFVVTYTLKPEYKFHVQAILCASDGSAKVSDATLLGVQEKASTFYDANFNFRVMDDVGYILCQMPGFYQSVTRGTPPLYRSHDRVLRHMCNWLRFLLDRGDADRSVDFLTLILAKHRQALIEADSGGDLLRVKNEAQFFDNYFPYEVFEAKLPLSAAARASCRDFLETMLLYRKKLRVLSPQTATRIPKDEYLLSSLK